MKKRKVALILSFIYCGLGQLYNRQVGKGINFIIIYTIMLVSIFVPIPSLPWLRLLGPSLLPLMWSIGMVDAYLGEEAIFYKKQYLLAVLPGAIISLLVFCTQYPQMSPDSDVPSNTQVDSPEQFSIEAASFMRREKAKALHDRLRGKGYPARVVKSASIAGDRYRVLVGKFKTEDDAVALAEELSQQEELSCKIVAAGYRQGNDTWR